MNDSSRQAGAKGSDGRGKFRGVALYVLPLGFVLASCGQDSGRDAAGGRKQTGKAAAGVEKPQDPSNRLIPPGESRIRTIVGEVLEDRNDEVGEWARKRANQSAEKRRTQRWLQPIDVDFGKQRVGTKLEAELVLMNPTNEPQKVTSFSKSCKCQEAVLVLGDRRIDLTKGLEEPLELAPGQKAKVYATVEVPDMQTRQTVNLQFLTSDPDQPLLDAQLHVDAVRDLHVFVGEKQTDLIDFGILSKDSVRDFEFRVVSRDGKPFTVQEYEAPLPAGVRVEFSKSKDDGSEWVVRGKLGPDLPENRHGGTVHFVTDRGKFEISVYATVQPPIKVSPSEMVILGVVPQGRGATKDVRFDVIDANDSFKVAKVAWFDIPGGLLPDGVSFGADIDNAEDGKSATVHVRVPPGLGRGRFQIGMLVSFEGDRFEPRKVRFIGHVR
ncbi:MAG: hypothetical protein H6832_03655 [Planctomycetes bacterium]|nr:hypothetical protein [Planctomycetota bacterium]